MKYKEFAKIIEKPSFTAAELRIRGLSVPDYQLSRWQDTGDIEKVQRGIYVFSNRKTGLQPEELSFILYQPSYLSIEYALHQYGFIPEMVAVFTAVTTRPTRTIQNQFGRFHYRTIAPHLFFGYDARKTAHGKYLIAHPEKALLDYLYLNPKTMRTKEDIEEMRFDGEAMGEILNRQRLKKYLARFQSKRLDLLINVILAMCSPSRN